MCCVLLLNACCSSGDLTTECSVFFCKQETAYEMRSSDWRSDVCSSDLMDARSPPSNGRPVAAPSASQRLRRADLFNRPELSLQVEVARLEQPAIGDRKSVV